MNTDAWSRQKGESGKSFSWFKIYRDLGPSRTLPKVIEYMSDNVKKSQEPTNIIPLPTLTQIEKQCSRWEWVKRCREWDNYQDQLEIQLNNEAYKQSSEQLINIGNSFIEVLQKNLEEIKQDYESRTTTKSHALKSVADAYDKTTKNIRLLHGKPTDIKDNKLDANLDVDAEIENTNITRYTEKELETLLTINDNEEEFKDKL